MLKHVQLSPARTDSISLDSAGSCLSSSSSAAGGATTAVASATPPLAAPLWSRCSSLTSLNETQSSTEGSDAGAAGFWCRGADGAALTAEKRATDASVPIKVFARCLRSDIEYKTVRVANSASCRHVVATLLNKYRMKHRDPNLFYLTMEVCVRAAANLSRTVLVLDDEAKPAQLQACRPSSDSRFILRMKPGCLVRIYDGILMQGSHYKSLLVAEHTNTHDMLMLILNCNRCSDQPDDFFLATAESEDNRGRVLQADERPLAAIATTTSSVETRNTHWFVLRRHSTAPKPPLRAAKKSSASKKLQSANNKNTTASSDKTTHTYHDYENYFYI